MRTSTPKRLNIILESYLSQEYQIDFNQNIFIEPQQFLNILAGTRKHKKSHKSSNGGWLLRTN